MCWVMGLYSLFQEFLYSIFRGTNYVNMVLSNIYVV
jgi:hypothetical protein